MAKNKQHTHSPLEKLHLFLAPDPDAVALMSADEVREELQAQGIDTTPLRDKIKRMVHAAMERWAQQAHEATACPSLLSLVLYQTGTDHDGQTMQAHLEHDACQRCRRLMQSPWLRTLGHMVQTGQRTQAQVQTLVAAAVEVLIPLPARVGAFAPTSGPPFRMRAVHPDGLFTVTLRETDHGELVVHVETADPEKAGRTVHVEVIGEGTPLTAQIVLQLQGAAGCAGRHTFGAFAQLAPCLGAHCRLLAVLIDEASRSLPDPPPPSPLCDSPLSPR